MRLLERRGEVLLLLSPALLGAALKLEAAGIDLDTALQGAEIARKRVAQASRPWRARERRETGERGMAGPDSAVAGRRSDAWDEINRLNESTMAPNFWDDPKKAQAVSGSSAHSETAPCVSSLLTSRAP